MKKELNNKEKPIFPNEVEIKRITKHFSENCKEINTGLMPNASELDKAKYDICQSISRYKRLNKITPSELAKKIRISKKKQMTFYLGELAILTLKN